MKKTYSIIIFVFFAVLILLNLACTTSAFAQAEYQPYSYQFYQKLNPDLYSITKREHTTIKPFFFPDSVIKVHYDSLMGYQKTDKQHSWIYRKIFKEHLIDIKEKGTLFYADVLPNFSVGRDFSGKLNTNTTSLGLQFGGSIGNKFQYYVSGFNSTAILPKYLSTYVNQVGVIPGQAYAKTYHNNGYSWSFLNASISYTPNKYLNISAGQDKTFIGDGYRSLLLSDYASPYPFLKLTGTLGNVRYMVMWTYMNDPATTSQYGNDRKKFGVFHYLDYNINNRFSVGFFENIIGFYKDDNGVKRPFDFNYINPIIFLKPVNNSSQNPDKSLIGFTGKYKINNGVTAYGQFALNEFVTKHFFSSDGSDVNKSGWQFGLRGTNLFKVDKLNFLIEANNVKPYTYSARSAIENYSQNGEPLAHPWGGNFRELVGLLNYSFQRFDFSGEVDLGRYGLNKNGLNYGKDIFDVYTTSAKPFGNYIGQGLTTNMKYLEGKVAFVVNPKYNLRLELEGIYRTENNDLFNDKTTMITIGVRSSFWPTYKDLASYKAH